MTQVTMERRRGPEWFRRVTSTLQAVWSTPDRPLPLPPVRDYPMRRP